MSRLKSSALLLAFLGSSALVLSNGCKSGGDGGDGNGGEGGDGEGGDGGGSAGKGGSGSGGKGGSGSGGKGGSSNGGSGGNSNGGSGGGSAGSGGSGGGGQGGGTGGAVGGMSGSGGGMAGSGGMTPAGCTPLPAPGTPDDQIVKEATFCEPTCIYRPNWPGHHTCGPAGSVYKPVAMKNDGFCGQPRVQDGIFMLPNSSRPDAAPYNATASGARDNVAGVGGVYLPGGMAAYNQAEAGKVAVTLWTSAMVNDRSNIEKIHEYLVSRNEIPYTIAVFMGGDMKGHERVKQLRDQVFPALKAKYSKISDDPNYRAIAGQSTAGADSFDTIWLGTDVIAKGIGGSPSVVCFTCMGGAGSCMDCAPGQDKNDTYVKEINFCPARPIRFSGTVGTCDIFGSLEKRLAAGCSGDTGAGAVDASPCGATWETANRALANALKAKGVPHQLFVIQGAGHTPTTWSGVVLPDQLRWIFKDITCKQ